MEADRSGKTMSRNPDVYVAGKSDSPIVPVKPANNEGLPTLAESVEERGLTNENTRQSLRHRTPSRNRDGKPPQRRSRGLLGVREAAQRDRTMKFTNLLHHVTPELLRSSFFDLKKHAAPGADGETWHDYEVEYERRLNELHGRLHRGNYRAQPSKRTYIPKPDGPMRPLGITAIEDKIVQRAVRTILECIYEQDFRGFSYGFRPRRGCHHALDALYVGIKTRNVNWILDADIRGFFDNISHDWLMKFLEHRIADPRMLRLLKKWLRAGVSEEGQWSPTRVGTPQGAVISPLLANVFLHYVFDLWIDQWRKRHALGMVIVVRYADDFVIGFSEQVDAQTCLAALKERMTKFDLELHPDKTRLIEFGRNTTLRRIAQQARRTETFDFLGFTHISGTNRKGRYEIHRRTARKKFQAALAAIKQQLRPKLHNSVNEIGAWLQQVYRGWCRYYSVPGNYACLQRFHWQLQRLWLMHLQRRSQRGRSMTWRQFRRYTSRWLPNPRILHPYPNVRFARQHQR
jgi:RNA-directed DNA polymerase